MYDPLVEWLNYHHLLYFWVVAREGTISAACRQLQLAQPTISAQLKTLEKSLGVALFERAGRQLALTDTGRLVFRYADEIFSLGRELSDALRGGMRSGPQRLRVGVADVLPKLVAYQLLEPALRLDAQIHVICHEGKPNELIGRLAVHDLDVVLTDSPTGRQVSVRAFNHLLGECATTVFAAAPLASRYRRRFPQSLNGAPFLLPTSNTVLRRALDHWLDSQDIHPQVFGEFEDSALLKVFGQAGTGLFVGPSVIEEEIQRQYNVRVVGRLESVHERFYAISVERKVKHPGVLAITETARALLFG